MKLHHAAMLALVGWYLMLPATAPQSGAANASPSPSIWNSYKTREACEQERASLVNATVVGAPMKPAVCLPSTNDQRAKAIKTPAKLFLQSL
jgi:hypothetical protein